MGRNKKSAEERDRQGNPGKRDNPPPHGVDSPVRCPSGLTKEEKKYWHIWAHDLIAIGKLNKLTVPSFLMLVKMKIRLDTVNDFLAEENTSLLQETQSIDGSGQVHKAYKESPYAKMSRDLTVAVHRLEKSWGLTGDSTPFVKKPKKSEEEEFLND